MSESDTTTAPAIRITGISKSFFSNGTEIKAVDDISFEIEQGSIVGLLGPNGAGKTTIIKSMLGLVIPDSGEVEIMGIDVRSSPNRAYEQVGAILEGARNTYWRLTVRENLRFFAGLGGQLSPEVEERHNRLMKQLGLTEKADTTVNKLSRGMKQKVSLASTLAGSANVVIMDEPTLGLDVQSSGELQDELRRLAEEQNITILLSSHDMDVVQTVCDDVIVVQDGRLLAHAGVDELLRRFQARRYQLTIDAPVDPELCLELKNTYEAEISQHGSVANFGVDVDGIADLQELLEAVRLSDQSLRGIQVVGRDLESIFVSMIEGNRRISEQSDSVRQEQNSINENGVQVASKMEDTNE